MRVYRGRPYGCVGCGLVPVLCVYIYICMMRARI